jgi:signal transduction histidine kinase
VAARLLHDLKNTIIGYNAALAQDSVTATEALVYKLQASKHRDTALLLIASLETLWGVLANPVGVEIHPIQFIRSVVAEEYPTLPGGVRLMPPVSHTEEPFVTSPELLRSILHNLIKNACEAMPGGGDINIDCVRVDGALILEVRDTGPGMSVEQIQKVLKGEAVASTRREGSGLGLLTVRAMVEKINGQIVGSAGPKLGMRWSIELNQLMVSPPTSEA